MFIYYTYLNKEDVYYIHLREDDVYYIHLRRLFIIYLREESVYYTHLREEGLTNLGSLCREQSQATVITRRKLSANTVSIHTWTRGRSCRSCGIEALGSLTWWLLCQLYIFTQDFMGSPQHASIFYLMMLNN